MKKLTKIKLINWHLFVNETIDVTGNILLTGENGSGKSTLLDAVQYVLSAGKAKFNTAANSFAKRTLEGYIRCKLGIENKTYLRPGEVTSHAALEFTDETSHEKLILGVVMEINKAGNLYEHFYSLQNKELCEELFFEDKYIRGYPQLKKYFLSAGFRFAFYESKEMTRRTFLNMLEIGSPRYFELIPKALAFRPIDELNRFVFDFLLNEKPVSIEEMRSSINSFREFENLVRSLKEKVTALKGIGDLHRSLSEAVSQKERYVALIKVNAFEMLRDSAAALEKKLNTLKKRLSGQKDGETALQDEIRRVKTEIEALNLLLSGTEDFRFLKTLEFDHYNTSELVKALKADYEQARVMIKNEKSIARLIFENNQAPVLTEYQALLETGTTAGMEDVAKEVKAFYEKLKEELHIQLSGARKELSEAEAKIGEQETVMTMLATNRKRYGAELERFLTLVSKEAPEMKLSVLCELIDLKDEIWRNAAEGYLNTQRFDIIAPPEQFDAALEIFDRYKSTESLSGIGLVNTGPLSIYKHTAVGSLASKLTCETKEAQEYVNMLLNNVTCVETAQELKAHQTAVTKDGMVYKNYVVRLIKKEIYNKPYLGTGAVKYQLEQTASFLKKLKERKDELSLIISGAETKLKQILCTQPDFILTALKTVEEYRKQQAKLQELEESLNQLKLTDEFQDINTRLKRKKDCLEELEGRQKQLFLQEGMLYREMTDTEAAFERITQDLTGQKAFLNDTLQNLYSEQFDSNNESRPQFKHRCEENIRQLEFNVNKENLKLAQVMKEYNAKHHTAFGDIAEYTREQKRLEEYELVKYEEKAKESRLKSEIAFKEQFICKLRENMLSAHEELGLLNQALKDKRFGGDEYEFIYKPENGEYGNYYKLIMNETEVYTKSLFSEKLNGQNQYILKELFEKLIDEKTDEETLKRLEKYCDYRNYMSYDIKIHHENGEVTLFSKVNREKSGGETQTPFYVVIASSFEQLIASKKQKGSPACFVMLDEAFNNMDEPRIKAMMEFYSRLNIQLMIAVPPQRIDTIIRHVNTTLVVIKDQERSFVETFVYDEKLFSTNA